MPPAFIYSEDLLVPFSFLKDLKEKEVVEGEAENGRGTCQWECCEVSVVVADPPPLPAAPGLEFLLKTLGLIKGRAGLRPSPVLYWDLWLELQGHLSGGLFCRSPGRVWKK